jgi:transcriptional regulator with XRE-family HTH domain
LGRIDLTRWFTMSDGSERNRLSLGQLVLARRKELGLSIREAARRAGVMRPTWTGLEQGSRRTADYNFAAMERTLGWAAGSIESVLDGGEPTPVEEPVDGLAPGGADRDPAELGTGGRASRGRGRGNDNGDGDGAEHGTGVTGGPAPDEGGTGTGPGGADPGAGAVVPWADIVRVLDGQLGAIGQAAAAAGMQRLWGAEQITSLARRLRPRQMASGLVAVVAWTDVVTALEATIAAIHSDAGMSSEVRLWGVEIVVDVAAELKVVRQSLEVRGERA